MVVIADPHLLRWYGFYRIWREWAPVELPYETWIALWRERYRWNKRDK